MMFMKASVFLAFTLLFASLNCWEAKSLELQENVQSRELNEQNLIDDLNDLGLIDENDDFDEVERALILKTVKNLAKKAQGSLKKGKKMMGKVNAGFKKQVKKWGSKTKGSFGSAKNALRKVKGAMRSGATAEQEQQPPAGQQDLVQELYDLMNENDN